MNLGKQAKKIAAIVGKHEPLSVAYLHEGKIYATNGKNLVAVPAETNDEIDGTIPADALKIGEPIQCGSVIALSDGRTFPRPDISFPIEGVLKTIEKAERSRNDEGTFTVCVSADALKRIADALGSADGSVKLTIPPDGNPILVEAPGLPGIGLSMPVRF